MKAHSIVVLLIGGVITACGRNEPPTSEAGPGAQTERTPQEGVIAPAPKPEDPGHWTDAAYVIRSTCPDHEIPHAPVGGEIRLIKKGADYAVETISGNWPAELSSAVFKFQPGQFCTPPPDCSKESRTAFASALKSAKKIGFSASKVKLHAPASNHEEHEVSVCPIHPGATQGRKEIVIYIEVSGGTHDGISHGVSN